MCVNKTKPKYTYSTRKSSKHILGKICSFNYHRREIKKLCHTKSKAPNYKFINLMRHFYKKDPDFSTYKKTIICFFMRHFNKMNQLDLIGILWLLCHLYSSRFISLPNNNTRHKPKLHKNKTK